jgi:hypothetical protein
MAFQGGNTLKVDLNFIAIHFIKHYWELHFRFRLKQSHSLQDANVIGILADFERESGWSTKTLRSLPDVKSCNKS